MDNSDDKAAIDAEGHAHVDPRIDRLVGDKLRSYFDGLLDAPVPDRIVELIAALGASDEREPNPRENSK